MQWSVNSLCNWRIPSSGLLDQNAVVMGFPPPGGRGETVTPPLTKINPFSLLAYYMVLGRFSRISHVEMSVGPQARRDLLYPYLGLWNLRWYRFGVVMEMSAGGGVVVYG